MRIINTLACICLFILTTCERKEDINDYDLFPLSAGNKHYYHYSAIENDWTFGSRHTIANVTWTNLSVTDSIGMKKYKFELSTYNRVVQYNSSPPTNIENITTYFTVLEDSSEAIRLYGFPFCYEGFLFQRFQAVNKVKKSLCGWEANFIADTGITYMNRSVTRRAVGTELTSYYSYKLDSLSIMQ